MLKCPEQVVASLAAYVGREVNRMTGRLTFACILMMLFVAAAPAAQSRALEREHQCLALALYWEARGESEAGMVAVGWTILNRTRSVDFPPTPCDVVFEGGERPPCQFSWWCDGKSDRPGDRALWATALDTAGSVLAGRVTDPTGGALFFHNTAIERPWQRTRTAQIGRHVFYR